MVMQKVKYNVLNTVLILYKPVNFVECYWIIVNYYILFMYSRFCTTFFEYQCWHVKADDYTSAWSLNNWISHEKFLNLTWKEISTLYIAQEEAEKVTAVSMRDGWISETANGDLWKMAKCYRQRKGGIDRLWRTISDSVTTQVISFKEHIYISQVKV